MCANFGLFILIFSKMALIVLGVLIVFTVTSFGFHRVKLHWLYRQFTRSQFPGLSGLEQCWSLITSCNRSQKQFPSLIWFSLLP